MTDRYARRAARIRWERAIRRDEIAAARPDDDALLALYAKWSKLRIARKLRVPESTVRSWIRYAQRGGRPITRAERNARARPAP